MGSCCRFLPHPPPVHIIGPLFLLGSSCNSEITGVRFFGVGECEAIGLFYDYFRPVMLSDVARGAADLLGDVAV